MAATTTVTNFMIVTTSGSLNPRIRLYNPAGAQIGGAENYSNFYESCESGSTVELNTVTLTATGTYTVIVGDCSDANTGSYWIYAQRTNNPAGATNLLFGGQPQTGTIGSMTSEATATPSAEAPTTVSISRWSLRWQSPALNSGFTIRLEHPTGSSAYGNNGYNGCGGPTLELNGVKLPTTGTYTVLVGDCSDTNTGNYNLSSQCFGVCASSVPTPLPQTITFPPLKNQVLGGAPFALSATASSGLAVTFASNTASVCTVSGVTVTLVAVGTCSITASQPGNSTYAAATPVTQTFTISAGTGPGSTTVYDLSSNWSNSSNPNGPWSYNQGSTPLPFSAKLYLCQHRTAIVVQPTGVGSIKCHGHFPSSIFTVQRLHGNLQ